MNLKLVTYPNPVLTTPVERIEDNKFDSDLKIFVDSLLKFLYKQPHAIGIAAPQVGVNKSIFVLSYDSYKPLIAINPVIKKQSRSKKIKEEGCLSLPMYTVRVPRPVKLTLEYNDLDGNKHSIIARKMLARAISHEIDHLNGKLIIDYIKNI